MCTKIPHSPHCVHSLDIVGHSYEFWEWWEPSWNLSSQTAAKGYLAIRPAMLTLFCITRQRIKIFPFIYFFIRKKIYPGFPTTRICLRIISKVGLLPKASQQWSWDVKYLEFPDFIVETDSVKKGHWLGDNICSKVECFSNS